MNSLMKKMLMTSQDFALPSPPDHPISVMSFSPAALTQNLLVAGSWDKSVRCWEVENFDKTLPRCMQTMDGPVLDVSWSADGTKVFMASCDKTAKVWDLVSNRTMQVAQHDAPIKTCHWIQGESYSCLMTGSWDKTLKFWDTRTSIPMLTAQLPEKVNCADVDYPMAVVGTAGRSCIVYQLKEHPRELKKIESPMEYENSCIAIFRDKKKQPTGFALGSIEGRVAIQYVHSNENENLTFKCHRSNGYAVNDMAFHPTYGTLSTVGSNGTVSFSFWDKDKCQKLHCSEQSDQPITACAFDAAGNIFAYAVGYDWKGHGYNDPAKKCAIFLRPYSKKMKPRRPS